MRNISIFFLWITPAFVKKAGSDERVVYLKRKQGHNVNCWVFTYTVRWSSYSFSKDTGYKHQGINSAQMSHVNFIPIKHELSKATTTACEKLKQGSSRNNEHSWQHWDGFALGVIVSVSVEPSVYDISKKTFEIVRTLIVSYFIFS